MTPLIRLISMLLFPAALLISSSHLLRAESGPGDGFTAGIISALAFTLQYEIFGYGRSPMRWLRLSFEKILITGLGLVILAALLPLIFGQTVLGFIEMEITLPVFGIFTFNHGLLLDIGIALVVFGGSLAAIESLRKKDKPDNQQDKESDQ